ncbi:acyl-CoA thioesterase [Microbulbifer halophilus]|uniref:Acyl-CoA thioesterase n=1 Tax=Microbulbifer halophilus TaxID=453963 RepID=A0ABW5E838_9GAMM|nr:acyl-CoA thioesterase [Microbulbifer halophilus]MCW8125237.1 acyl-CoA thioesterase [Microbulbifer halophilus]
MASVRTHSGVAHTWLCDEMGHLNTRNYVGMFDDAMQHFMLILGHKATVDGERRLGWADVRHEIDYIAEVPEGALVHVECEALRVGNSSITYRQTLILSETAEVAAVNRATSVLFDLKKRTATPIPDVIRQAADRYMVEVTDND